MRRYPGLRARKANAGNLQFLDGNAISLGAGRAEGGDATARSGTASGGDGGNASANGGNGGTAAKVATAKPGNGKDRRSERHRCDCQPKKERSQQHR